MRTNIKDVNTVNCFGCGVCAKVCPKQIIKMRINKEGFFEPYIVSENQCIKCGLCLDVCSYNNDGLALNSDVIKSYASWSKNEKIRSICSSGGVGFELANTALSKGYKVCSVRYNIEKKIAEHYIAINEEELKDSIGSKYIQSDSFAGMNLINPKEKYIIFGTPCHIDSFRRYLRLIKKEANFILVDFFCHGVPSYLLWEKYINSIEKDIGKIKNVKWRDKKDGWHSSWVMNIKSDKCNYYSSLNNNDIFLQAFISDACLANCCYDKCKFKYKKSSADIRLGDAWGNLYKNNQEGVSAVICFTKVGNDLLNNSNVNILEHDFEQIAEYQMKENAKRPYIYKLIWNILKSNKPLDRNKIKKLFIVYKISLLPRRIINKLIKLIK